MTTDRVAGGALTLLAAFVLWESRRLPLGSLTNPGPAYLPVVLALALLGLGAVIVALGGRAPVLTAIGWGEGRHALLILGACAFAALGLERLGYRLTMLIMLAYLVGVVERRGWLTAVVFAAAMAEGSFYLFGTLLRVPLPRGPFGL
jgi:hypothetical protein